jgi:hypothetical protein
MFDPSLIFFFVTQEGPNSQHSWRPSGDCGGSRDPVLRIRCFFTPGSSIRIRDEIFQELGIRSTTLPGSNP